MVSIAVVCCHCGSDQLVRNGHAANGKQMYKCKECGRNSRESPEYEKYTPEQKETILRAYLERPSMRGIERIFGLSRATLSDWLKKRPELHRQTSPQKALASTLLAAEPEEVFELDEMWSYVGHKKNPVWIWIVRLSVPLKLCRRTRQVVAWMWLKRSAQAGDRSADTCEMLWDKVPENYKHAFCYSDLLAAYQKVLDAKERQACTKREGQTNHIERLNLTVRQRLARFVRKTLSFSKSLFMHIVVLRLFFHTYNHEQARKYNKPYTT